MKHLSSLRTHGSSYRVGRILLLFLILALAPSAAEAAPVDTVLKHICLYTEKINDAEYFTFNGDGHQYDVSFDVPSGMVIEPQSPIRTSFQRFYVSTNVAGTYYLKVSYTCVDPNCHETDFGYVQIRVENCDGRRPYQMYCYDQAMAPDVRDISLLGFEHVDPVTGTPSIGVQLFATTSYGFPEVTPDDISQIITPTHIRTEEETMANDYTTEIPVYRVDKKSNPNSAYNDVEITIYEDGQLRRNGKRAGMFPLELLASGSLKIDGDDLYAITNTTVFVSRDSEQTWQRDTNGLGQRNLTDLALDRNQNVYLATSTGILSQTLTGTTWNAVTSFPKTYVFKLFCSRKDVLYASTNAGIWMSKDEGLTWVRDSLGFGTDPVVNFGDDAYGNVYAIGSKISVTSLYKQSAGSASWTNIQSGLSIYVADPKATNVFHAVKGDSSVYVATTFGIFQSSDQGSTWHPHNNGLRPANMYSLAHQPNGNYYLSTNQGIFRGHPNDSDWKKLYPSQGYLDASPVFRDNAGSLYGLGNKISLNERMPVRSTDDGISWSVDTAGHPDLAQFLYYVDELGTQYMATLTVPVKIYTKHTGQPWKEDDAGIPAAQFGQVTILQSDGHGSIYLGTSLDGAGGVWKRPISGGTWAADSNGLGGRQIFVFARDNNGSLYGGTYQSGVIVQQGGVWQSVTPPAGVDKSYSAFALSVDSSNTLVVAYGYFGLGFQYHLADVYYRPSVSGAWTSMKVKAKLCTAMISVEDTTYLITSSGLMSYYPTISLSVPKSRQSILTDPVSVQPNPSSGRERIIFHTAAGGPFTVEISDVLGNILRTQSGSSSAGQEHRLEFDLSECPEATYYVRLQQMDGVRSAKLVIAR